MEENNNENLDKKENVAEKTENEEVETVNSIKISNDAVAMYVGIAIAEIQGVYGMSGTLAGITEAISR